MPRKSIAKPTLLPSTGTSCDWTTKWIACCGLSGPATLLIGSASETRRPERTSPAAARTFSGVMKFIVPSSSSGPQRPQFFTDSKIASNSEMPNRANPHLVAVGHMASGLAPPTASTYRSPGWRAGGGDGLRGGFAQLCVVHGELRLGQPLAVAAGALPHEQGCAGDEPAEE